MGPVIETHICLRAEIQTIISKEKNKARQNPDTGVKNTNQRGDLIEHSIIPNEIEFTGDNLHHAMPERKLVVSSKTIDQMIVEHLNKNAEYYEALSEQASKKRRGKKRSNTDDTTTTVPLTQQLQQPPQQ